MNSKTFINSRGQATFLPKYFRSSKYLAALQRLRKIEKHLKKFNEVADLPKFLSGRIAYAAVTGALPAYTEMIYLLLKENKGRVDSYNQLIWITSDDVMAMFEHLDILHLLNADSLRQAYHTVSVACRDSIHRQMSVEVFDRLTAEKTVSFVFPKAGLDRRGGRGSTGIRFK